MMKIEVRYMAQLRQAAGTASEQVEVADGETVQRLLIQLTERHPDLRRMLLNDQLNIQPTILVFLGDTQIDDPSATLLTEGDTISLLSPIAGGQSNLFR